MQRSGVNQSPKKIALAIHGLQTGGAEMFCISLANGLFERGYEIVLILLDNNNPLMSKLHPGVRVFEFPRKGRLSISTIQQVRKVLIQEKVLNLICIEPYAFLILKFSSFRLPSVKLYLSIHNSMPFSRKKYFTDRLILKVFSGTDHTIFICNKQKEIFEELYGFTPKNANVIYNGIDTDFFSPIKTVKDLPKESLDWQKKYGVDGDKKTILLVGRISVEKGHHYALEALSILRTKLNNDAVLIIVGAGSPDIENSLRRYAEKLGIAESVIFAGMQKDVRPFLLNASIFTLTSNSETFSIAALEAMSMGMPCSLTDVGGAKEMLRNEFQGALSRIKDPASIAKSWDSVLRNQPARDKIREHTIEHFSKDRMLNHYENLLFHNSSGLPRK